MLQYQDYESLKLGNEVLESEIREKDEIIQEQENELSQLRQGHHERNENNAVHPGELKERLQALVTDGASLSPDGTENGHTPEGTEAERLRDIQSEESQSVGEIEALTSQIQDKDYIIEDLETQLEQVNSTSISISRKPHGN